MDTLASLSAVYIARGNLEGIALTGKPDKPDKPEDSTPKAEPSATVAKLSQQAQAAVARLKTRDLQVRAHEQAHLAAAGGLVTSGPSYVYQKGPDGVNYAVGGEVSIDVSPGRDAQDTISRAERIRAAALAPVDPSSVDFSVAAQAQQMEQQARVELQVEQTEQQKQSQARSERLHAAYGAPEQEPAATIDQFA